MYAFFSTSATEKEFFNIIEEKGNKKINKS